MDPCWSAAELQAGVRQGTSAPPESDSLCDQWAFARKEAVVKKYLLGAGVFAVVLSAGLIGFMSGCGGGGSDADTGYNFNGYWKQTWTVVSGTSWTPGDKGDNWATISQSGTSITLEFPGRPPMSGTCDPVAGTFSVSGVNPPQSYALDGWSTGENSMAGQEHFMMSSGSATGLLSWTMELIRR